MENKKFLDQEGVKLLWSKISMEDYPNNETLIAVLNAIDQTKADRNEIKQPDWNQNDETQADYIKNKPIEVFLVEMPNEETLSHSFAEILAAHKANKLVFAKLYGSILAPLTYIPEDETYLVFSQLSQETTEDNTWLWMDGLTVYSDDTFFTNFKDILSTESSEVVSLSGTWNIPQAISELTERVQEISEVGFAKADWNESDTESPSYIQNRTHWVEFVNRVAVDMQFGHSGDQVSMNTLPMFDSFSDGAEVIITLDDTVYETTAYQGGDDWFFLGNGELVEASGGDTSLPFGIYINSEHQNYGRFTIELPDFFHLKIECLKREVHKISSEFLPENVATGDIVDTKIEKLNEQIDKALDGKSNTGHNHYAQAITQGVLSIDRIPKITIAKGGTGATTAEDARTNLEVYSKSEVDTAFVEQSNQIEDLYKRLDSNATLGFYCIEDVTIVLNGVPTTYPANSNVEIKLLDTDVFEIIPTSDNSILSLNAFPGALGTYYPWLEGVKQFSNILFDMNDEAFYSKWSQGNQGAYQVQYAQYINCIFWSDNPYVSDVSKRTNYTLYYTAQLPLCYSSIPDNTFKSFYLAFNVNSDPNWGNKAYRDSFAKATWATQVFSYYGARTIGIFGHDDPDFNITLPKDCRGLMYQSTAIENAGTFDAINTTNFGATGSSWQQAFGQCSSLRNLYIKNLTVNLNVSWSPLNYQSIYFIISKAANENAITISVSPYTYNLLGPADFELATSKNITIKLVTTNYVEDKRFTTVAYTTGDGEFTGDVIAGGNGGSNPISLKSVNNLILEKASKTELSTALSEAKTYTDEAIGAIDFSELNGEDATDEDIIDLLIETGFINPVSDAENNVLTDNNDTVLLI